MSKLRKGLVLAAVVFSLLASAVALGLVFAISLNFTSVQNFIVKNFFAAVNGFNMETQTILNVTLVYYSACAFANGVLAHVYFKYYKFSIMEFLTYRKSLLILFTVQLFVGVIYLANVVLLLAIFLPLRLNEFEQLKHFSMESEKKMFKRASVEHSPEFFTMSMQIAILKETFKKNKMSKSEYLKKLNEIVNSGAEKLTKISTKR